MSEFLNNLKKAVEDGEFNSDAANKINEIDEKAKEIDPQKAEELINKRLEESGTKVVSEDEAIAANSEYDKQMEETKKQENILRQIAMLREMEHMIELSISDVFDYIRNVKRSVDEDDSNYRELFNEMDRIEKRFSNIVK